MVSFRNIINSSKLENYFAIICVNIWRRCLSEDNFLHGELEKPEHFCDGWKNGRILEKKKNSYVYLLFVDGDEEFKFKFKIKKIS